MSSVPLDINTPIVRVSAATSPQWYAPQRCPSLKQLLESFRVQSRYLSDFGVPSRYLSGLRPSLARMAFVSAMSTSPLLPPPPPPPGGGGGSSSSRSRRPSLRGCKST